MSSYTITPAMDGPYIILKVTGIVTRQGAMEQNIEAHALGGKLGINRYLVDVTEAWNIDPLEEDYQFIFNDMRASLQIDKRARVATLVAPGDHSHDFIATVARNAGLDVTLFTDRERAVRHLLQG